MHPPLWIGRQSFEVAAAGVAAVTSAVSEIAVTVTVGAVVKAVAVVTVTVL